VRRMSLPGASFLELDAYRPDRLWVTLPERGLVEQVDTRRAKLVGRPIRVPGQPTLVTTLRDSIVVDSDPEKHILLRRYDKATGRQIGASYRSKGTPTDLGSSTGVSMLNWMSPAILTFDENLQHPTWIDFKFRNVKSLLGPMATEMTVTGDGLTWVLTNDSDPDHFSVVRANLRTHKQIGNAITLGRGLARDLAYDGRGNVWVPNLKAGVVVRVDARTARVVGAPIEVGDLMGAVAAADGRTWVAGAHDLIRITP